MEENGREYCDSPAPMPEFMFAALRNRIASTPKTGKEKPAPVIDEKYVAAAMDGAGTGAAPGTQAQYKLGNTVQYGTEKRIIDRDFIEQVLDDLPGKAYELPLWGGVLANVFSVLPDEGDAQHELLKDGIYNVFDAWSKKGPRYSSVKNRAQWDSHRPGNDKSASFATLIGMSVNHQKVVRAPKESTEEVHARLETPELKDYTTFDLIREAPYFRTQERVREAIHSCVFRIASGKAALWYFRDRTVNQKFLNDQTPFTKKMTLVSAGDLSKFKLAKAFDPEREKLTTLIDLIERNFESTDWYSSQGWYPLSPGATIDKSVLNTFAGFEASPVENVEVAEVFLKHMFEVICDSNQECYDYLLNWMAWHVQRPSRNIETAVIVVGAQGVGKNAIFDTFGHRVIGNDMYLATTDMDVVAGSFNESIRNRKSIVLNEASLGSNWAQMSNLKSMITESTTVFKEKHVNNYEGVLVAGITIISNYSLPVKIENDDRRFLCLRASDKYKGDREYLKRLWTSIDNTAGANAIMFELMKRDLADWDIHSVPVTTTKKNMMRMCENTIEGFARQCVDDVDCGHFEVTMLRESLYPLYERFCRDNNITKIKNKTNFIAEFLEHKLIVECRMPVNDLGKRPRGYRFNVDLVRAKYAK
jgi:hypothetical protein